MIVVDASVLADSLADDGTRGDRARAAIRAASEVAAPDIIDIETMSALRRLCVVHRTLTPRRFAVAVGDLAVAPLERHPSRALLRRVYDLRNNLTAYDAAYVALAEALRCDLVTADADLAGAPGPRCSIQLLA